MTKASIITLLWLRSATPKLWKNQIIYSCWKTRGETIIRLGEIAAIVQSRSSWSLTGNFLVRHLKLRCNAIVVCHGSLWYFAAAKLGYYKTLVIIPIQTQLLCISTITYHYVACNATYYYVACTTAYYVPLLTMYDYLRCTTTYYVPLLPAMYH